VYIPPRKLYQRHHTHTHTHTHRHTHTHLQSWTVEDLVEVIPKLDIKVARKVWDAKLPGCMPCTLLQNRICHIENAFRPAWVCLTHLVFVYNASRFAHGLELPSNLCNEPSYYCCCKPIIRVASARLWAPHVVSWGGSQKFRRCSLE